ncbi:MAG: polyprenyl synthetase family protein [Ktedonobacteraceae bacterium]
MALLPTMQLTLLRHQDAISEALRKAVLKIQAAAIASGAAELASYYGQIQYHLGWVDENLTPLASHPGKLLRPTLLLFAYEAAGASNTDTATNDYLRRALPAAAAIELTHNFTLIHDDIEDGDTERRHRSTLWKLWGIPQAINSGDGLFALARLTLWGVLDEGVKGTTAARLGAILDRACLVLSEGQFLDINFERALNISVASYIDMISRKTAALMGCAAEMGALLGTSNTETIERLRSFGYAMGIAFQVRDDLLGVWATTAELGKTPAGDIYRRKKSLPVLHALEQANPDDQQFLRQIYQQETPLSNEQVAEVLTIFERTQTKAYCRSFLTEQCRLAHEALASVPRLSNLIALRALDDMQMLVQFVEETAKS